MHFSGFFKPVPEVEMSYSASHTGQRYGEIIAVHNAEDGFPPLDEIDLVIFGIDDDRGAVNNTGCAMAAQTLRKYLYNLMPAKYKTRIADLGDIMRGDKPEDTYFAVSTVIEALLELEIVPVVIGGGQDHTFAMYRAYKNRRQIINIAAVDNMFDLGEGEDRLNSRSYLSHIILHKPNFLFNYTNLGYQTFFVEPDAVDLMNNLFFDTYRLGVLHSDIPLAEPMLRDADLLSFDMSAIRQSDAPGNANATPNGLYGEEACQIARYAGMSEKLSAAGFFELNPVHDPTGQTAHLLAQMIWYFIDGFYHRQPERPDAGNDNFVRYNVQVSHFDNGIIFYQSKISGRWWMEVKKPEAIRESYRQHFIVPCTEGDYQTACNDEMPDRWWKAFQKLM